MKSRISKVTSDDVLRIIRRDFPKYDSKIILDILRGYSSESSPFRVHLAALKLSKGNIKKLRKWIKQADIDFRDVLSPAEYPRFYKIGFIGVEQLSPKEIEKLKNDDWEQYQKWFKR